MKKRTFLRTQSKFIVNEQNKIVVCIMQCSLNVYKLELLGIYPIDVKGKKISHDFQIKTFAKCSPEDTFSEKIGKRIAESKAKKEAFKECKNIYLRLYKHYSNVTNFINKLIRNSNYAAEKENNRLFTEAYLNGIKS